MPIHLLTTDGFIKAYEKIMRQLRTKKAAFEMLNKEHERYFGHPKYSNYDSFRHVMNKKIKK